MPMPVDGMITCSACKTLKHEDHFYWISTRQNYHSYCKPCYKEKINNKYGPKGRERVRDETLAAYGGKCACCGETWKPFLSIDHINGGGNDDRESKTGNRYTAGYKFYIVLRQLGFPKGYQVLCYNCNCAKERGGCPDTHRVGA